MQSDLFRAGLPAPPGIGRDELLRAHVALLSGASGRDLWMPAYNYDFPRTKRFDVREDVSEVGPLTEHFRRTVAAWRTATPIFSVAGEGASPTDDLTREIDPFGERSAFAELVRRDGVLLFYGASFDRITFLHHAERSGPGAPLYRYDKYFTGTVVTDRQRSQEVTLIYHVRPRGQRIDYAWDRLLANAVAAGVCRVREAGLARATAVSARGLLAHWRDQLERHPLYLIDESTRVWVEPMLQRLGRRFELQDFEATP